MDHEVQVISGAYTGIIRYPDQLPLADGRTHHAQRGRDAILGEVHIELVGGGAGAGVFQNDKVGVGFIPVWVCPNDTLNYPAFGSQHVEHAARIAGLGEVEGEMGSAAGRIAIMTDALGQNHGIAARPGQVVAAQRGAGCGAGLEFGDLHPLAFFDGRDQIVRNFTHHQSPEWVGW